jgi:hypothetical protein
VLSPGSLTKDNKCSFPTRRSPEASPDVVVRCFERAPLQGDWGTE